MDTARCIIEVTAGVIPGQPEAEYTRQYAVTSAEWNRVREGSEGGQEIALLAEKNGIAQGYASMLMLQPSVLNWVRVDWLWL